MQTMQAPQPSPLPGRCVATSMTSLLKPARTRPSTQQALTSAPSRRMRNTLSAWRSMSFSPMYTTHSRPARAHTVACRAKSGRAGGGQGERTRRRRRQACFNVQHAAAAARHITHPTAAAGPSAVQGKASEIESNPKWFKKVHARAHRGHAVLARPRLRDDALLAHALAQQRLRDEQTGRSMQSEGRRIPCQWCAIASPETHGS